MDQLFLSPVYRENLDPGTRMYMPQLPARYSNGTVVGGESIQLAIAKPSLVDIEVFDAVFE
jgi:hypothetical protein